MEYIALKNICKINMGQSPDSSSYNDNKDGIPFFQGNADFGEKYPVTRVWCNAPIKVAQPNDILISVRAPIGALNFAKEECCIGRGLAALTPDRSKVSLEFIYWVLKWKKAELNSKGTGSTFKAISRKVLEETLVPAIDFEKQYEYVEILGKTYSVIKKYKKELNCLDGLIKARFVEMFGDPIQNPKGWEVVTIGDIVTEVRYGTSKPAVEGGKYPYLRMNNLTADGHLDLNDLKYIDIPDDEIEKCVVRKGDVLFNRTNSIELVGKTAVFDLPEDMIIAGYIIRVRLTEKMLPEVLSQYMNLEALKGILRGMAKGAVNQANINAQELQSIKVYIPEMELQKQFVKMKEQIYKSKVAVQKALDETQMLFDSLMQEYFN